MPQHSAIKPLGLPFVELQSVDSTNNYARQQIHAGLAQHGTAFFAHEQLAGKGQRGKVWTAEKGANIILSLIIKPQPLQLTQNFQLIACTAVAVQEFFAKYAGDDTKIKWPNDLYWQDRKAGGMLIENVIGGEEQLAADSIQLSKNSQSANWKWAIAGIGININQTVFKDLKKPVSLKQITGKNFDPVELAKALCKILDKRFTELTHNGFENIYKNYLAHLYKKNMLVKFKKENKIFEALIKSVSSSGKLIVQHGIEEEIDFGEVEWLI